mmetsp:Transcript_31257/g.61897  ORF Transcript_31257/g.61897 Transcript_31257/m.61897 type:complete len:327 (-) Transcript_31257:188-1168(-)
MNPVEEAEEYTNIMTIHQTINQDDDTMFSGKNREDDASGNALVVITDAEIVKSEKGKVAQVITDVQVEGEGSGNNLWHSQYDALQKLVITTPSTDSPKKKFCIIVAFCIFFLVVVAIILSVFLARSQEKVNSLSDRLVGMSKSEPVVVSSLEAPLSETAFPTSLPTEFPTEFPTPPPTALLTDPPSQSAIPPSFYEVSSGTCETNGYRSIYQEDTCAKAIDSSSHIDTWGAFPFIEHAMDIITDYDTDVVDGCSLGHGSVVSVRSAGSCRTRPLMKILQDVTNIFSNMFSSSTDDDFFDDDFFGDDDLFGESGTCECSVHRPCFCQ